MHKSFQGSNQPRAATVCQGYREIDIGELEWIPLRWFLWWWGWPCVKVNVKGLFVSVQQPSMRETTEDRPEYSPVTGHAEESSICQPLTKFWLACTVLLKLCLNFSFSSPLMRIKEWVRLLGFSFTARPGPLRWHPVHGQGPYCLPFHLNGNAPWLPLRACPTQLLF